MRRCRRSSVYETVVESTAQTYIRLKNRRDDTLWQELVTFSAVCFDVLVKKKKRKKRNERTMRDIP